MSLGSLAFAQQPSPSPTPLLPPPLPEVSPAPSIPSPTPKKVENYQPELPALAPTPTPSALKQFQLRLAGNRHFTEDQIRTAIADQITAIQQSGLSGALADDTAFYLGVFYRKNGYSQAAVQWAIKPGSTLLLTITEGPLTQLGAVTFHGNEHVPDSTLSSYLTGSTTAGGTRAKAPPQKTTPYVESDVKSGVDRIRGYYRSEGYLDSVVDEPQITLSPDKTRASVLVQIHEGTQYHFGKLSFEGDIVFFPQRKLLKELEVITSKPYTPLAVTSLERKIVDYYRSRGYFKAQVHTQSDPTKAKNGIVPVSITIAAGDIYRFDGVTQTGLRRLRHGFLPARFRQLQGKIYDPAKVEELYRKLMGTGLFANLKMTQIPHPNHEVELHFDVEEAKSRELGFSVGYASLEGAIVGARALDRDLFGFGRPLSLDVEVAQRLVRGEFIYTDPWFLQNYFTLRLRLYELSQDLIDYSKMETGFRIELSRKITTHFELTEFILTRVVDITNYGIDPADLGRTHYLADSVGISATLDYRDSVLNPTKGFVVNTTSDVALDVFGSSLNFFRSTFRASYYQPVGKTVLAMGVRGGLIDPLSGGEIPIDERFFNGGPDSVRSYVIRSLGPKDPTGHSIGGETFTNANIEDVFPLFDNVDGALFFDYGSVGNTLGSGLGVTGYAIGPGLRYKLPIGPVRLDYGFNPFRRSNQPFGAVDFSFGFAF